MTLLGTRATPAVALLVATVVAIVFTIYLSLDPRNYHFGLGENRADWVYDPWHVALTTGLMLIEAACAGAALFSPRPRGLWIRCLLILLVFVPWAVTVTPFVIHMPLYFIFHHLWLWLLLAMLIVA